MFNITKTKELYNKRKARVRIKLKKNNYSNRIRLSIFKSGKHTYGQFIDDSKGTTLASASSLNKKMKTNSNTAREIGYLLAEEAKKINLNLNQIVFDKGGYHFHGRVKALVDAVVEKLS